MLDQIQNWKVGNEQGFQFFGLKPKSIHQCLLEPYLVNAFLHFTDQVSLKSVKDTKVT